MKCGYGLTSFLLTGDYTNRFMTIPTWCLPSRVLKFPHHGAPLTEAHGFLETVNPALSIISVGEGNPFGHPDPLNGIILRREGSLLFRTDLQGGLSIYTDGNRIIAKTAIR
jgi:competence protein ComEC